MELAPIVLFAYNRPAHLRATLGALAANPLAAQSELWVYSDAAKDESAAGPVAEVREIARSATGFGAVHVIERTVNQGLVGSITSGVSEVLAAHGRAIILEDDLITAPGFLGYMNQALQRYESDTKVMQVSGYMYPVDPQQDACFLPTVSCWGWGTWKRAWDACYDPSASGEALLNRNLATRKKFDLDGAYDYSGLLKRHLAGEVSSWGVLWYLSVFARDGLVLHPPRSLVSNEGFDGSGSHRAKKGDGDLGSVDLPKEEIDIRFPSQVAVDDRVFGLVKASVRRSHRGWRNLARRMSWRAASR